MRIGIDVRYLSHGLVGGVHTYVKHLVPALIEQAHGHQIFLYADTKRPFELSTLPHHVVLRLLPWRGPLSSIYHDFSMWQHMAHDKLEVVHYPANYGFGPRYARTVITLHDAINLLPLPEIVRGHPKTLRTIAMMTYLHVCTRLAVRRAHLLITVSQYSRREILRYARFAPQHIVAMTHGPAPSLRRIEDAAQLAEVREHYQLTRPFVLADALKNPAVLVRAWRQLPAKIRRGYQIVFFSRRPDPPSIVFEAEAEESARLLINPPARDLMVLYSLTEAFIFPSWFEGLGLPLLEAMTCGAPVIASNRGSIPEVVEDGALLMDAEDDRMLARHIELVLSAPAEAQRLRERGFARAAQFSWRDIAVRVLKSYAEVLALPSGSSE